jgi:hypothetical protein
MPRIGRAALVALGLLLVPGKVAAAEPPGRFPGLIGIVFDNPAFAKPVRVWTVTEPDAALFAPISRHDFSLRLTGSLEVPFGGPFEIRVVADDAATLRLDGSEVLSVRKADRSKVARVPGFTKGRRVPIEIDYVQDGGASLLGVMWREAGSSEWTTVPAGAFSHTAADRARMEAEFAGLMRSFEREVLATAPPAAGEPAQLKVVRQGVRDLLRVSFARPTPVDFDCWMYESAVELVGARELGGGRVEATHRVLSEQGGEVTTVVTPAADSIEVAASWRSPSPDGTPPPLDLCWQLRRATAFASFPDAYPRFAERCFIFTAEGRRFLSETRRFPSARFASDDPVNNPPWVQSYRSAGNDSAPLPFPWTGVSTERFVVPVAGVVSRDGRWLVAIANDNGASISQVWIDCLHNNPEWRKAPDGAWQWRLKIYVMRNQPELLLDRVATDFPRLSEPLRNVRRAASR